MAFSTNFFCYFLFSACKIANARCHSPLEHSNCATCVWSRRDNEVDETDDVWLDDNDCRVSAVIDDTGITEYYSNNLTTVVANLPLKDVIKTILQYDICHRYNFLCKYFTPRKKKI